MRLFSCRVADASASRCLLATPAPLLVFSLALFLTFGASYRRVCGQELMTLTGRSEILSKVAFSPDRKAVATGGYPDALRVWDVGTGKERICIEAGRPWPLGLAFSPDGKMLAAALGDQKVRLWDPATGKELEPVRRDKRKWSAVGLAFSPDGKLLACGTPLDGRIMVDDVDQGEIIVWDLATRKETRTILAPEGAFCLVFSPDGKSLASGDGRGRVWIWDLATGKEVRHLRMSTGQRLWSLAYAPDGKALAAMGVGGPPQVWDPETGRERFTVKTGDGGSVAFSPDGKLLGFVTGGGRLTILDAATGKELVALEPHRRGVDGLAFSPDSKLLATVGLDGLAKIWNVAKLLGEKGQK